MRIGKNKIFVMLVVMAMVLFVGTSSLGEELHPEDHTPEATVIEEAEEFQVREDPAAAETQDDGIIPEEEEEIQEKAEVEIIFEEVIEETDGGIQEDTQIQEEPVVEEEPVFVEEIIPRYVSLRISVEPDRGKYTNGELIQYDISIENNGTDPIEGLDVSDDMGVNEKIGCLDSGERVLVTGSYEIDDYNRMESIGNTVSVSAVCDGERVSGQVGYVVSIEIPQGSISITNNVIGVSGLNNEFTILVEGPNNYINYVQLGDSDNVTIRNLFIGDYAVTPLECMNCSSIISDGTISITEKSLNKEVSVEYSLENTGWFSDSDSQTIEVMDVDGEDIDYSKIELQSSDMDIRSDEIYLDLEPLIVLVEVQVEALQQPEGEESSSVADPVQEVTSEPVEAGLQEEVTEPDAAEGTEETEQEVEESPVLESENEDENVVVEEPVSPGEEEDINQIYNEEQEAIIPEDPLEELSVPLEPEEEPTDSV
ncbi:hypothetical protein [Gudongella sp. SC589]|uniref:hypothetical protein n=1 Tax=Gudongella sp. SC589 TaxID=3385990 RepID=UPI003904DEA6